MKFEIAYNKNRGLIISPTELKSRFLFGVDLKTKDGRDYPDAEIRRCIQSAQDEVESMLDIRIQKRWVEEQQSFYRNDFESWGYISTNFPVVKPFALEGWFNTTRQLSYPKDWMTAKKSSEYMYERRIQIVPNNTMNTPLMHTQISPFYGLYRSDSLPDYWLCKYITGYEKTPADLVDLIGKYASINILLIIGDLVLGLGVGSTSIGIDGLSQSISSTKGTGSAFSGRIKEYNDYITNFMPSLKSKYKGLTATVL